MWNICILYCTACIIKLLTKVALHYNSCINKMLNRTDFIESPCRTDTSARQWWSKWISKSPHWISTCGPARQVPSTGICITSSARRDHLAGIWIQQSGFSTTVFSMSHLSITSFYVITRQDSQHFIASKNFRDIFNTEHCIVLRGQMHLPVTLDCYCSLYAL